LLDVAAVSVASVSIGAGITFRVTLEATAIGVVTRLRQTPTIFVRTLARGGLGLSRRFVQDPGKHKPERKDGFKE
jgi:hypothetical protein